MALSFRAKNVFAASVAFLGTGFLAAETTAFGGGAQVHGLQLKPKRDRDSDTTDCRGDDVRTPKRDASKPQEPVWTASKRDEHGADLERERQRLITLLQDDYKNLFQPAAVERGITTELMLDIKHTKQQSHRANLLLLSEYAHTRIVEMDKFFKKNDLAVCLLRFASGLSYDKVRKAHRDGCAFVKSARREAARETVMDLADSVADATVE